MSDERPDKQSKAGELMKKLVTVGMGTVFLTEESLKALVSEFKLPKEIIGGLLESTNRVRKEFLQDFSRDLLNRISEKTDPVSLVSEFFHRNELELQIKVKFSPKKAVDPGAAAEDTAKKP